MVTEKTKSIQPTWGVQAKPFIGLLTIHTHMQPTTPSASTSAQQPGIVHRLTRLRPYFVRQRRVWALAIGATLVAALTEPMIPALFQPLLDNGFAENDLPL